MHIKSSNYQSKQFEGNQCRLILKNIHKLSIPSEFFDFRETLIALRKLYKICNADYLSHNYVKVIDEFSHCCYKLTDKYNVSTTPTIHILL